MNMKCNRTAAVFFAALLMVGCAEQDTEAPTSDSEAGSEAGAAGTESTTDGGESSAMSGDNPFLAESPLFLRFPPFDRVDDSHYLPAFEAGMEEQLAEIDAIVNQEAAPTVENTLAPLERSGQILNRVSRVYYALRSAHTNDAINEIEAEIAPRLAAHQDQILLNGELFARVKTLYDNRESLDLDPETLRLVEESHRDFVRAGATAVVSMTTVRL